MRPTYHQDYSHPSSFFQLDVRNRKSAMTKLGFFLAAAFCVALMSATAWGQTTLYSENFGTGTTFPTGWTTSATDWSVSTASASSGYTGVSGVSNVTATSNGALVKTLTYSNSLSTVGFNSVTVLWGQRYSAATFTPAITFQWSTDGTTWNTASYTDTTRNGTWALVNGGTRISLPAGAEGASSLRFRWFFTGSGTSGPNYRLDDFSVQATATSSNSSASDIIAAGNETSNIDYASKQSTTISTTSDAVRVWSFTIRDGGGSSDADSLGTILTSITIGKGGSNTVSSWTNSIREAALFDGSTKVAEVSVTGESITFSGLSGANVTAADDGSKTLDLYLTFETTVTDNQQFQFLVTGTSTDGSGSAFAAANAGGASSSTTGDSNRIEVTADRLAFVQQPLGVPVNTAMSPAPSVQAADANNNRDLDYSTSVSLTASGSTLSGSPVSASSTSGLATFNSLTFTTTGTGVTLTATSGSLTNGTSNSFNVGTAPTAGQILINQFNPGYGGATDEYIELVNMTSSSFDLSLLRIDYQSAGELALRVRFP
jgi:hypothetical protein